MSDKRLASVDSVTGTTVQCTLAMEARGTPMRGKYVVMRAGGDFLLGRIVSVDLTNQVHDDPTFAAYIMMNGAVPHWSSEVDIEKSEIEIIRVVEEATSTSIPMRRNPSSGTPVVAASPEQFQAFRNEQQHILKIGQIPNSDGLEATIINRHHGDFESGGYGEARHCCLLGQNGSGKTVMATMLLAGKLAAHPQMGLLMPDTAGDLSNPDRHDRGDFHWNYVDVLKHAGVAIEIIDIDDIRLSSPRLLAALLRRCLTDQISMASEKAATLAERIVDGLCDDEVKLTDLTSDAVAAAIVDRIELVYAKASRAEKLEDARDLVSNPARRRRFDAAIENIRRYFDGRVELAALIDGVLSRGRKVVIKMEGLNEQAQALVMREVMTKITRRAQWLFKARQGQLANAIVVLDEAARWVPEGADDNDGISEIIRRSSRETRKYGLGWWFIAQSPATISKTVLKEAHTKWFGRGLGIGADRSHLDNILGKSGVEEYERLMMQGGYFWLGIGLDNNIGTEGTYFAVHPFGGNATRGLIDANRRIFP